MNEVVPAGEVEMSSPNKNQYSAVLGSTPLEGKTSSELTWVNLNFKVKDKNILTKCWGKVSEMSHCTTCMYVINFDFVCCNRQQLEVSALFWVQVELENPPCLTFSPEDRPKLMELLLMERLVLLLSIGRL